MPYKDPAKARENLMLRSRAFRERKAWALVGRWEKGLEGLGELSIVTDGHMESPIFTWVPPRGKRRKESLSEPLPKW